MNNINSLKQLLKWGGITLKENNISNYIMEAQWLLSFVSKVDYELMVVDSNKSVSDKITKNKK